MNRRSDITLQTREHTDREMCMQPLDTLASPPQRSNVDEPHLVLVLPTRPKHAQKS